MHGCGWDSGTARERSSALAASVASRYALGADGPGARGSRVTASRYALGAEGGGTARPGAYMCPPRNCARCLLEGSVGMSKTSCAARCSRGSVQGVLRAPAEGEGGVAHREDLAATASATLDRSAGTVAHDGKRAARDRRRRRSKVSRRPPARRPPAAGAPWEARARAARVQTAGENLWWWVVRTPTPNYLRLASPDRGKYFHSYSRTYTINSHCLTPAHQFRRHKGHTDGTGIGVLQGTPRRGQICASPRPSLLDPSITLFCTCRPQGSRRSSSCPPATARFAPSASRRSR